MVYIFLHASVFCLNKELEAKKQVFEPGYSPNLFLEKYIERFLPFEYLLEHDFIKKLKFPVFIKYQIFPKSRNNYNDKFTKNQNQN